MAKSKKNAPETEDFDDTTPVITLSLDDGSQLDCYVISTFPAGAYDYVALLPCEGEKYEEGEVYLYRFREEDGEPVLGQIESDEEFELVSDAFDEILDSMEYDEMIELEDGIEAPDEEDEE